MCTACTLNTTEYPPAHEHRVHCSCTPGAGCTLYAHRLWSRCTRGCSSTFDVSSSGRRRCSAYRLTSSHPSCDCLVQQSLYSDRSFVCWIFLHLSWVPPVSPPSLRVGRFRSAQDFVACHRATQPFLTRDGRHLTRPTGTDLPSGPANQQATGRRGPRCLQPPRATCDTEKLLCVR